MIKAACMNGWLEERPVVLEALIGTNRPPSPPARPQQPAPRQDLRSLLERTFKQCVSGHCCAGIRRAGADIIFTYFARDAAVWLRDDPFGTRPGFRHLAGADHKSAELKKWTA